METSDIFYLFGRAVLDSYDLICYTVSVSTKIISNYGNE